MDNWRSRENFFRKLRKFDPTGNGLIPSCSVSFYILKTNMNEAGRHLNTFFKDDWIWFGWNETTDYILFKNNDDAIFFAIKFCHLIISSDSNV